MEHIWVKPLRNIEINIRQYGKEACAPCHTFGPAVRDHFLLHFVTAGKGVFSRSGASYTLGPGEGFLIFPDEITCYEADKESPWCYSWVGFSGQNAKQLLAELGLSPEKPIFRFSSAKEIDRIFSAMEKTDETSPEGQLCLTGHFFMLLSLLSRAEPAADTPSAFSTKRDYVTQALLYIRQNYAQPLTVSGIAQKLGIHRAYFSAVFREHTHTTPQAFILQTRMEKAAALMHDERLSILHIARSVGYEDALQFSKMFKKHFGLSPREFRKEMPTGIPGSL